MRGGQDLRAHDVVYSPGASSLWASASYCFFASLWRGHDSLHRPLGTRQPARGYHLILRFILVHEGKTIRKEGQEPAAM